MSEQVDGDLRQGAKAAAAAAAVGAAVGVARAIATRADHATRRPDPAPSPEPEDEQQQQQEHEHAPEQQPKRQDEHPSEPEQKRKPVKGDGAGTLRRVTEAARALLQELSGADVESVTALDRTPDGWRVTLEVVEVRRIPDSTDVLATYDVELDGDGDLVRYERRRRYSRAQSDFGDVR